MVGELDDTLRQEGHELLGREGGGTDANVRVIFEISPSISHERIPPKGFSSRVWESYKNTGQFRNCWYDIWRKKANICRPAK